MKQIPKTLKFLAVFLAFAFCLQILPQMVLRTFAEEIAESFVTEPSATTPEASETEAFVSGPEEIVPRRTETAKHFRMPDGTVLVAEYPLPVHYEKDGQWVDVDNTLSFKNGEYVAESGATVRFAKNGNSHKLLELSQGDYNIRFGISSSAKSSSGAVVNPGNSNDKTELTKLSSGVYYSEVLENVDLEYRLISNRIKENIIIKQPLESYVFAFDLKLQNLSAELQEDGSILLSDGDEALWTIPAPFAYDAEGTETQDVSYTLTQKGNSGNYTLTVSLSETWADSAAFPITVDPQILRRNTNGIASFTGTRAGTDNSYYLSGTADTVDVTLKPMAQLGIPSRAIISSGVLKLRLKSAPAAPVTVGAYEVSNGVAGTVLQSRTQVDPADLWMEIDLSKQVHQWQTASVQTIRLVQTQYTAGSCEMSVYGLDSGALLRPYVTVFYYDSVGVENYFSYSQFPLTSSALLVKHATGQGTVLINGLSSASPLSFLNVSAVFNTDPLGEYTPETYFSGLPGAGWKLTCHEYVIWRNDTAGGNSGYVYIDGDGTAHYFKANGNIYYDEDGLGLTLIKDPDALRITLTDKSNHTKTFSGQAFGNHDLYYLISETTEAGHLLQYYYTNVNGKKQLFEIEAYLPEEDVDGELVHTLLETVTFQYNTAGYLSRLSYVVDSSERYRVNFRYDSAGNLVNMAQISVLPTGTGTLGVLRLTYTDGRITTLYDDNLRYDVTYSGSRIASVKQRSVTNASNTAGPVAGFTYLPGCTKVRTGGGDDLYGNSDDLFSCYIYDQYGRTTVHYTEDLQGRVHNPTTYQYTPTAEDAVNFARHQISTTVYGGTNSFYDLSGQTNSSTAENYLSDASFEASSWILTNASRTSAAAKFGSTGLQITENGKASQTYTGASWNGTPKVYLISAWGKADSMRTDDTDAFFGLRATVNFSVRSPGNDPVTDTRTVEIPFQWLCEEWQYAVGSFVVQSTPDEEITAIHSITVECVYENNVNTAYFDAVTLSQGVYENTVYDEDGDVSAVQSSLGSNYSYVTDSQHRVTSVTRDGTETANYTYKTGRFSQYLDTAQTPLGLQAQYTYNDKGQVTATVISNTSSNDLIRTQQIYDSFGFTFAEYDSRGNVAATYSYSNLLLSNCSVGGVATSYEYNTNQTVARTYIGGIDGSEGVTSANAPVTYSYDEYNPLLLETVTTPQNSYTFWYNDFDQLSTLRAGSTSLVSYTYQQGYGKLTATTYANGFTERYGYDTWGNLNAIYYNNSTTPKFSFLYDGNNRLVREDSPLGYRSYQYDTFSRMTGYTNYVWDPDDPETVFDFSVALVYDDINRVSQTRYSFLDRTLTYVPTYGTSDRLEKFALSSVWSQSYVYDELQRLDSKILKNASEAQIAETSYTYAPGWSSYANATTTLVASEENSAANETWSYSYDNKGRIIEVYCCDCLVIVYSYDSVTGFLRSEDNALTGKSYYYTYDEMGNMLTKKVYEVDLYASPADLLSDEICNYQTSPLGKQYQGTVEGGGYFEYDSLGNLFYEDENYWTYLWNGSLLTEIQEDGGSPDWTYGYNADGIRTWKSTTDNYDEYTHHLYTLDGTTIVKETIQTESYGEITGESYVYYYYDDAGSPIGMNWNNADYYFYKNIFGDVLGIMNSSGTMVVRYTYNAWGVVESVTGTMASTLGKANPFRYRGYFYDVETGLYYLQARYYNPEWGRFISPDPVLDTTSAIGCNMYAYCGNDPVNRVDPTGRSWVAALILGIVAVACIASLSGCTPSTGAAPDYVEISSSNGDRDENPNCYSYAIGYYDRSYNPGDFSTPYTAMTLDAVGNAVMRDMEALGRGCRPLEAHNSPIKNNEYRIALKVSEPKILVTESGLFVDWDYHFMVQTSSGQWAEKHGPAGATILHPSGNPSTISWDLGDQIGYYTEGPLYFAITH